MIYELLFPLRHAASWLGWLNVLRYIPFRVIMATITAMLLVVLARAVVHPRAAEESRSGRSSATDGPETHQIKARHADHGRRAHPALACSCRRCSGRSHERLRPGDDGGHRRVRRHRLPRRLPQDQAQELDAASPVATSSSVSSLIGGAVLSLRLPRAGARCRRTGGTSASRLGVPFVAFSKHPIVLPLVALRPVRGLRRRRDVERGEPHRRPRRSRHRPGHDQRGHVPRLGVPRRRDLRHRERLAALRRGQYLDIPRSPAPASSRSTAAP